MRIQNFKPIVKKIISKPYLSKIVVLNIKYSKNFSNIYKLETILLNTLCFQVTDTIYIIIARFCKKNERDKMRLPI